ncbi:acyltransferase [Kluyvera sp. CHPC 1.251]|uniref:acyltransferase n=1 Tax=Kluyvera sp. CHPC 1.251 TaxID=2995175 RepID=UPI002FD83190
MVITEKEALRQLKGNLFLGDPPELINSTITFSGTNNILACEKGVTLQNSQLNFNASHSIIYLGASRTPYIVNIATHNHSVCYFGRNSYINDTLTLVLSEERHILIGDECCISHGIWMRNADPHLIFSANSNTRINPSRSIYIGDRVWLGQNAMILKGSIIHSGSIVGAMSLVAGKEIGSNSCWVGNPARKVKDNVFWSGECVHHWTNEITMQHDVCDNGRFTFEQNERVIDINALEDRLNHAKTSADRFKLLLSKVLQNQDKNRFYG